MSGFFGETFTFPTIYADTTALAAVDMSLEFDGVRAGVTNSGVYQYSKQATSGTVQATGGGYWNVVTDPYVLMNTSNQIDGSQIAFAGDLNLSDGSAATPSLAFASDLDTGMYRITTNSMGLSTGGTLRVTLNTANLTSTLPLAIPAGAAATPALAIGGEQTGPYLVSAATLGISLAGTQKMTLSATALNVATGIAFQINAVQVVGARNTGWVTFAGTGTKDQSAINVDTFTATDANLRLLGQSVKGILDALILHGLLGA